MSIDAIRSREGVGLSGSEAALTSDEWSLAALAVPAGSRVLAVASADAAASFQARLVDRGCTLEVLTPQPATWDDAADAQAVDVAVLADGFEQLDDPIAALRDLATRLAAGGRLILVADNAAHAAAPRLLRGEPDGAASDVPPRRYDLAALERVILRAGLVVTERLRATGVGEPNDESLAPAMAAVLEGPESRTRRFVLVAEPSTQAAAPAALTVAEALQAALDDLRIELRARGDALRERIEEVERLHVDRRHLELDLAVKDNYITEVRTHLLKLIPEFATLQMQHDEVLASRQYRAFVMLNRWLQRVPFATKLLKGAANRLGPATRRLSPRA